METQNDDRAASRLKTQMGKRLKLARLATGLVMEEFAGRLGPDGTRQKIWNYESGTNAPPHLLLHRLEAEYGITASWIVSGKRDGLPKRIIDKMPTNS